MPKEKSSRIFPIKFRNYTQVLNNFKMKDNTKKINMNLSWPKEIF